MMFQQILYSVYFYFGVIAIFRLVGKRQAGQTTTFDLMILIALVVALQSVFLLESREMKIVFVVTVFLLHLIVSKSCMRFKKVRHLLRGKPTNLIQEGEVLYVKLREEGLTLDELNAGLRKMGIERVEDVKSAFLEETGQISAVRK